MRERPLASGATVAPGARACQRCYEVGTFSDEQDFRRMKLAIGSGRRTASNLYIATVDAARAPVFYRDLDVADTIEGRYEMIVLHVVLLVRRLRAGGPEYDRLSQAVVDYMASDLDRSIRELGVGDLSVGKFMKTLGQGLYGRAKAYDEALDLSDAERLEDALLRNIYDGYEPPAGALAAIARYVRTQQDHLAGQPIDRIASGTIDFAAPVDE